MPLLLLLLGLHEVFPMATLLKGEILRRMGNFPLCARHCGFKTQGGPRPGGGGARAEHSTPIPLPLEPSRGRSLSGDKGLHYLCSACQRLSAAAAVPLGNEAGSRHGQGTAGGQG